MDRAELEIALCSKKFHDGFFIFQREAGHFRVDKHATFLIRLHDDSSPNARRIEPPIQNCHGLFRLRLRIPALALHP